MSRALTKPVLKGLNTKLPPVMLSRDQSPDMLNCFPRDGAMQKRGGFVPFFRDRMLGDAVENVAWHTTSRLDDAAGTGDGEFVVSPGWMIAGHRAVYDDGNPDLTLALWFSPTKLTSQVGGNGANALSAATYKAPPYTVKVLPIISKGPAKKSDTATGVAVANQWGTNSNAGMPFCLYIFNSGTGTAPVWEWRLSAHVLVAGNWTLQTVTHTEPIIEGARYHIIAAVTGARVALRIARVRDGETPTYSEVATAFTGSLAANKCPIQVFDCPYLFPQCTAVGSATQRPGLGFTSGASGGYWFSTLRPEGKIDDISIWRGDRTLSTMERTTKVTFTGQTDLINLWSMAGTSLEYVKEETGRGNHLFFVPRAPIAIGDDDGGKQGGTWFFNGTTSWVLVDTFNNPNWRNYDYSLTAAPASGGTGSSGTSTATGVTSLTDGTRTWVANAYQTTGTTYFVVDTLNASGGPTRGLITANNATVLTVDNWTNGQAFVGATYAIYQVAWKPGAMYSLVRDNMAHGIASEFWVDSHEPAYEQVIVEIHGVMKLSINATGNIVGYCRDGGNTARATTALAIGENYQGPVTSTTTITCGRRYSVALMRRDGGTALDLYVNGFLEASATGLHPSNFQTVATTGNSHAPGGLTFGIGSLQRLIHAILPIEPTMATSNQVANDVTSGFVGRIETVRILCSPNAATLVPKHGPEADADWHYSESRIWRNPFTGVRGIVQPNDPFDTTRNVGRGAAMRIASQESHDQVIALPIKDTANPLIYSLGLVGSTEAATITTVPTDFLLGHNSAEGVGGLNYYVLGYWSLNVDPLDKQYGGRYVRGLERRYDTTAAATGPLVANQTRHPKRSTHLQFTDVVDAVGLLGNAMRCCNEADQIDDSDTAVYTVALKGYSNYRQRPYQVRSPVELGLRWSQGLALPALGTTPVRLVKDFDVQTQGRRLTVTGCGRSLYWAKPAWDEGYLFFAGGLGSYVRALQTVSGNLNLTGSSTKSTLQVTMWVKPLRLDGLRVLMVEGGDAAAGSVNWMIYTDNGSLTVAGEETTSPGTWRFCEGQITGGPADVSRSTSLKVGVWNHVCVLMGGSGVSIWVNGQSIPLVNTNSLTGSNQTDPWGTGTSRPANAAYLFIGGMPDGYNTITLRKSAAAVLTLATEAWWGYIADAQIRPSADSTRYTSARGFPPPIFTVDASSTYRWPMNEGRGWLLQQTTAGAAGFNAEVRIREFYPIASGIRQGTVNYRSVAFRDRLIVTNGADNPLQITFSGFATKTPWTVTRVGMSAPVAVDTEVFSTTTGGSTITAGIYDVYVTFVNADGLESEGTFVGSLTTVSAYGSLLLNIYNLPRSHDPQVVTRWLYASGVGGGDPIFNRELVDNDSLDGEVVIGLGSGDALPSGNRFPAPRARHVAIAGSSLVLADLPDIPAGQNAFSFSATSDVTAFPLSSLATRIDSQDGRKIVGIGHNRGTVFFSKRDSIHQLAVGAIVDATQVDAQLQLVQPSDGVGGGSAAAGNLLFGAGDRGVFAFNNTDLQYLSDAIEPTWRALDLTNDGMVAMVGAFWRRLSQFWISVRAASATSNVTIFVYDNQTDSWSPQSAPAHTMLTILERAGGEQVVAIGTTDGRVLWHDIDTTVDGADNEAIASGACTLLGNSGLSGTSTSLTMSGALFQTELAGLQGAAVTIVHDGVTETRRITRNTGDTFYWDTPLTGWTAHTSFTIGVISGYWTSPWMWAGVMTNQHCTGVSLEFLPQNGSLSVDVSAITRNNRPDRLWPTATDRFEHFDVDMTGGSSQRTPRMRDQKHGQYHRIRIGTYGINDPFGLVGYAPDIESAEAIDQPGRLT